MKTLKKPAAVLLLVAVTIIWGSGFTVVKSLMDAGMSVGTINMFRGFGLALLMLAFFGKKLVKMTPRDAAVGIIAGVFNAGGYLLQSAGLMFTTPSTSAFLTILNTVFVPFIVFFVYRAKLSWRLLPAVLMAIVGTFFLTGMNFGNFTLGIGELLTLGCALSYAALIAFIGNTGKNTPTEVTAFWMGAMQGISALIYFFIFESRATYVIDWSKTVFPIIYLIVLGSFFTTFAQVASQKSIDAPAAAMIMTLEAVFGTLISLFFGYDMLSWGLLTGGLLIMGGVIIILLPQRKTPYFSTIKKPDKPNAVSSIQDV